MECKKERIFENTYRGKCKDQENSFNKVTDEHVHDSKALPELVNGVMKSDKEITIGKLFAGGSYDNNDIFKFLADKGIQPCIKVRKNARADGKKETYLETYQF